MKLNIGGQQSIDRFPKGWTCLDILPGADIIHDLQSGPLPLEDSSVEAIYCSHVLEHLWPKNVLFVLREFYRILVKDVGRIRIVVPDMEIAVEKWLAERENNPQALWKYMSWWFDPTWDKEDKLYLNHVGGFDYWLLNYLLKRAGFSVVFLREYNDDSTFRNCDNPDHIDTSLYVEAIK